MQINLDITVAMPCMYLDINIQDSMGDRVLAGELLKKQDTQFDKSVRGHHVYAGQKERFDDELWDVVGKHREGKFGKRSERKHDACRIYGEMREVNKVQGDFHITAKGHGYYAEGAHLEHTSKEYEPTTTANADLWQSSTSATPLTSSPSAPSTPLSSTPSTTQRPSQTRVRLQTAHSIHLLTSPDFYRYQYYLNVVPTTYKSSSQGFTMDTNQYSVTVHERELGKVGIPGIFFKFDIEPIHIQIEDERVSFISFVIRLVNVLSGIAVAGGWIYAVWDNMIAAIRKNRDRGMSNGGMLGGFHKSLA